MSTQLSFLTPTHPQARPRNHHQRHPIPGDAKKAKATLARWERSASDQSAAVLAFFRVNPGAWKPSQVWKQLVLAILPGDVPLTSIRRAITNLTNQGFLRLTLNTGPGLYGRPEHMWTLNGGESK